MFFAASNSLVWWWTCACCVHLNTELGSRFHVWT
jgi:hypothetical protein